MNKLAVLLYNSQSPYLVYASITGVVSSFAVMYHQYRNAAVQEIADHFPLQAGFEMHFHDNPKNLALAHRALKPVLSNYKPSWFYFHQVAAVLADVYMPLPMQKDYERINVNTKDGKMTFDILRRDKSKCSKASLGKNKMMAL